MEQKKESLKWQRNLAQTVKAIKKQPQRIEDLEKKGIKRREAYRCLEVLKDIDLIKESKGEYIWKSGLEEFKNVEEYKIKLNHSKNLVRQVIEEKESNEESNEFNMVIQIEEPNNFNIDINRFEDSYNFGYLLQHLKTGYPDIYKLYEKLEKTNSEMEKVFSVLYQKIKEIALETDIDAPKLHQRKFVDSKKEIALMPANIFYSLKDYLNFFFDKDTIETIGTYDPVKDTWIPGYRPVYSEEDRKEFIENCISSEDIKKLHSELVEISKKTERDYALFNIEIKFVIIKVVEDGEPLRGNCDRCPKITIGRSS